MIKPKFVDLKVDFWLYPGKCGLSRPTLCVYHQSREIGAPILDAIFELKSGACPVKRTLTFLPRSRKPALTTLQLWRVSGSAELCVMNMRCNVDQAIIEMTDVGLELLTDAFSKWLAGGEDFGVAPRHANLKSKELGRLDDESLELWFWGPSYEP